MRKTLIFAFVLIIQVGSLFYMGAKEELVVATAPRYYFKTQPVDPRDIFRGDYVVLSYPMQAYKNELAPDDFEKKATSFFYRKSYPGYIALNVDSANCVEPIAYSWDRPDSLCIKVNFVKMNPGFIIKMPIGKYFVEQGKGLKYEQVDRNKDLFLVEVALASTGKAIVTNAKIVDKNSLKEKE